MVFSGFHPPLRACLFLSRPYTLHALNRSSNLPLSVFLRDTIFLPFDSFFQPFSLVSTRFLQARRVSDIIGGLGETFQWKNVTSRVSVRRRIEKKGEISLGFTAVSPFFPSLHSHFLRAPNTIILCSFLDCHDCLLTRAKLFH